jgi:DNA gyrase/topoisomerase IV subunit A
MAKRRQPTKNRIIRLPISKQIDVSYRGYALYVLENRGIPSFYDGLTNVQRVILNSSQNSFENTPSLIGSCFKAGYHHGDASLGKAINKLTKVYSNSVNLLDGDGFFGNPINADAAAARYTKVKINKAVKDIINESSFLNEKIDGAFQPFWMDSPIGLTTQIVGIAVGYKTTILPRKLKDIKEFIAGDRKTIKPYFQNFDGKIKKVKDRDKTWLIEGVTEIDEFGQSVTITELPPLMKYGSLLKKIDRIIDKFNANVSITNDSTTKIRLKIKYKGKDKVLWSKFKVAIDNASKMMVTETPVFIKDGSVIEYDRIEDYLEDYRYRVGELNLRRSEYFLNVDELDLEFNKAKKLYLEFMLAKKHKDIEIDKFLSKFDSSISGRLNHIFLRTLTAEELIRVQALIKELTAKIKVHKKEVKTLEKTFTKLIDTANTRKVKKSNKSVDLFDGELTEVDGIEMFTGDDMYDVLDDGGEEEKIN